MCVKIIGKEEHEFNPLSPLECQIIDAKEIVVDYEPSEDGKIFVFLNEIERMVKTGAHCTFDIKVNANNDLNGIRLERKIEKIKVQFSVNEVIKGLTILHDNADRKLGEISQMCLGEIDER